LQCSVKIALAAKLNKAGSNLAGGHGFYFEDNKVRKVIE
jgi:hypothetical protein